MDLEELRKVITIFEASSLSELEIEQKGVKFRLAKKEGSSQIFSEGATPEGRKSVRPEGSEVPAAKSEVDKTEEAQKASDREVVVRSPLVGTFYRAHSPEEEPFAEVGQYVHPGQTLCIIEAMKVMNEIASEVPGTVKKILAENGQPVEYDQELLIIEKNGGEE